MKSHHHRRLFKGFQSLVLVLMTLTYLPPVTADDTDFEHIVPPSPSSSDSGGSWRFQARLGLGFEDNVRPAPPSPPSAPSPGMGPPGGPGSMAPPPAPPAIVSPGDDVSRKLILGGEYHYRHLPEHPEGVRIDWRSRLELMFTDYEDFSTSNEKKLIAGTRPQFIYGANESWLEARYERTDINDQALFDEFTLRFLQFRMLNSDFGIGVGADMKDQQFEIAQVASRQDHRRGRVLGSLLYRFAPRSELLVLAGPGKDEGLQDREDYDVLGAELFLRTQLTQTIGMRGRVELEHYEAEADSEDSYYRRKYEVMLDYRFEQRWLLSVFYKYESPNEVLPRNQKLELTLGLTF